MKEEFHIISAPGKKKLQPIKLKKFFNWNEKTIVNLILIYRKIIKYN